MLHRPPESIDDVLQLLRKPRRATVGGLLQRLEAQFERGELLPQLIVQFARDTAPLFLLHGDELPEELLAHCFGVLTCDDFRIRVPALRHHGREDEDRHRLDA